MPRPPRPVGEPILDAGLTLRTALVSLALGGAAFGAFEWAQARGLSNEQARTIAINMIVVTEVGYLFACRSLRLSLWRIGPFSNPWVFAGAALMLVAQLAFTYLPAMNRLFHTAPIEPWWWGLMTAFGALIFFAAEAKKLAARPPAAAGPSPQGASASTKAT